MTSILSPLPVTGNYNVEEIRRDFPIFQEEIYGKPLTFLDSAASAQKPRQVLDAMERFYTREYANIHRGVYYLSQVGTQQYEDAREKSANSSMRKKPGRLSLSAARPKRSIWWPRAGGGNSSLPATKLS